MKTESFKLSNTNQISSISNCVVSFYGGAFYVVPELKSHMSNDIHRRSGNGDSVIGYPDGYQIDEEYIISMGWGDGFAVHSINDEGVLSEEFSEFRPVNNYEYYSSLAINKKRKIAIIGNFVYDNLTKYDFDGDWSNQPTKTIITESASGLPSDEVGDSYMNGLAFAGDWLYIMPDDRTSSGVFRWNVITQESETLTISSYITGLRYGWVQYDEQTDRIYMGCRSDGAGLIVVTNASSDTEAVARALNLSSAGMGSNAVRVQGVHIDPRDRNRIFVGSYYRIGYIDITKCVLNPNDNNYTNVPTKILPINTPEYHSNEYPYFIGNGYFRLGGVEEHDVVYLLGDRGWGGSVTTGFVDRTTGMVAYVPNDGIRTYQNNPWSSSYGQTFKSIISPSGIKFWLNTGYGYDGYAFSVWSNDTPPVLQEEWEFTTTGFQLSDQSNITKVEILDTSNYFETPTGKGVLFVSNNNGETWEKHPGFGNTYIFESVGNQFKMRFLARGTKNSSVFFRGNPIELNLTNDLVTKRPKKLKQGKEIGFKLRGN